jgi:hypothetical protein
MPLNLPITASGSRSPEKPRAVPKHVRRMITLMVRGAPDDCDCAPMSFIEAARLCDIRPDIARKWLDRPEVRRVLLAERRVFRDILNAGNEAALAKVRDTSKNGMSVVASVRALEDLAEVDQVRASHGPPQLQPGLIVVIEKAPTMPAPVPTIDITPAVDRAPELEPAASPARLHPPRR